MFVDCHSHILPGVDDGARTMQDALTMARIAVAEGTTHLFATPHGYTDSYHVDPNVTLAKVIELNDRLQAEGIGLTVLPAMELHHAVVSEQAESVDLQRLRSGQALGLGARLQPRFVLLEFSFEQWPTDAVQALRALRDEGIQVILAHPERYDGLQRVPERILEALEEGAWMQLTTGSIVGRFGATAQRLAHEWLAAGYIHIIASDAHGPVTRPPGLREAFTHVRKQWGLDAAADRCMANAEAILVAAQSYSENDSSR